MLVLCKSNANAASERLNDEEQYNFVCGIRKDSFLLWARDAIFSTVSRFNSMRTRQVQSKLLKKIFEDSMARLK